MNKPAHIQFVEQPTLFTASDYAVMMAAGLPDMLRFELVRGELQKMMPSGFSHGEMNATLAYELRVAFSGTDRRFATDLAVEIDALTVRGADIAVVLPDTPLEGPVPASYVVMVAEIARTSLGKDLGEKLVDYARAGVPEYWVADLDAAVMHVMRSPDGNHYAERRVIPFGTPIPVPGTDRMIVIG